MIDGATAYRAVNPTNEEVGELLGEEFRVYAQIRRGRGESPDTAPYAVQREIEDLAALFEPPFVVDNSRPPRPADYVQRLDDFTANGRRGDAVELLLIASAAHQVDEEAGTAPAIMWSPSP